MVPWIASAVSVRRTRRNSVPGSDCRFQRSLYSTISHIISDWVENCCDLWCPAGVYISSSRIFAGALHKDCVCRYFIVMIYVVEVLYDIVVLNSRYLFHKKFQCILHFWSQFAVVSLSFNESLTSRNAILLYEISGDGAQWNSILFSYRRVRPKWNGIKITISGIKWTLVIFLNNQSGHIGCKRRNGCRCFFVENVLRIMNNWLYGTISSMFV